MSLAKAILWKIDYKLIVSLLLVPICGLVVLFSAGYDPESTGFSLGILPLTFKSAPFVKQLLYVVLGLIVMIVVAAIPPERWARISYVLYGIMILALVLVLIPGIGLVSNGARRWFSFGGFSYQPSETMKFALIVCMARYLSRIEVPEGGLGFKNLIGPAVLVLLPMGLIIDQPDLGTALSIGMLGALMILFIGVRLRILAICTLVLILGAIPAWTHLLHPYQQRRVLSLLNPEDSPLESGYHIVQSKIAVGSGELFGKGYMSGTQTQLGFLPEHTTDFIFSVLSEEWGFMGSVTLIALYLLLLYMILRVAARSRDLFGSLVCVGVAAILFVHIFVNIGMVIGILPVVGITLPLFSYGGSSMLSFMSAVGLVLGVQLRRFSGIRGLVVIFPLLLTPYFANAQEPGRITFEPLGESTVAVLMDRFSEDPDKLKALPPGVDSGFDITVLDFWSGADTKFGTSLKSTLYFNKAGGETVKVLLEFEPDDRFLIRTSNPRYQEYLGGVRAAFPTKGHTDIFIPGQNGAHTLAMLSDYGRAKNRVAVICMSEEQVTVQSTEEGETEIPVAQKAGELIDSGYSLSELGLTVRGAAEGTYTAGTQPGFARASILVTPGLLVSDPIDDTITAKKPNVDIRYVPRNFEEARIRFDSSRPLVEGIAAEVEFKSAIGLKLWRRSSETIEVRAVSLKKPVVLDVRNSLVSSRAPGECVFVRYQLREEEKREDPRAP